MTEDPPPDEGWTATVFELSDDASWDSFMEYVRRIEESDRA